MKRISAILILFLIMLSSLITAKNPSWLNKLKTKYPDSEYITATGTAPDVFHAQNNALATLFGILYSDNIPPNTNQVRYTALMTEIEKIAAESNHTELIIEDPPVESFLDVMCEKEWDDRAGNHNAFAYLHRQKAAEYIKQNITETSNFIRKFQEKAMLSSNSWSVFACFNAANVINLLNEELLSQLAVISPEARAEISLDYDSEMIKMRAAEMAKTVRFSVEVFGETGDEDFIQSEISNFITSGGWQVSEENAALLEAHIYLEEDEQIDSEYKFSYTYSISIYSPNGELMFNMTNISKPDKPGEEKSYEESLLEKQNTPRKEKNRADALKALSKKLRAELPRRLNQYFDRLAIEQIL